MGVGLSSVPHQLVFILFCTRYRATGSEFGRQNAGVLRENPGGEGSCLSGGSGEISEVPSGLALLCVIINKWRK